MIEIILDDNLKWLRQQKDSFVDLIYIDPPFNTGKKQKRTRIKTKNGKRVKKLAASAAEYDDNRGDYVEGFLRPRIEEAYRVLKHDGSFFFHLDYREIHYCKVMIDSIFGRECFMNEIIWAYDYGGRSKNKWSAKHDNILWYVKDTKNYTYNYDAIDRIPYMAPSLQKDKEKAAKGKTPTDVWWNTIVPTQSKEKVNYPTQKPLAIINRIVKVHSNPDDLLLDFFAGSGTLGESAYINGRNAILVDNNPQAKTIMIKRMSKFNEPNKT